MIITMLLKQTLTSLWTQTYFWIFFLQNSIHFWLNWISLSKNNFWKQSRFSSKVNRRALWIIYNFTRSPSSMIFTKIFSGKKKLSLKMSFFYVRTMGHVICDLQNCKSFLSIFFFLSSPKLWFTDQRKCSIELLNVY